MPTLVWIVFALLLVGYISFGWWVVQRARRVDRGSLMPPPERCSVRQPRTWHEAIRTGTARRATDIWVSEGPFSNEPVRVIVHIRPEDGGVREVYVIPESAMSEEGMQPIHDAARVCAQKIVNVIPEVCKDLDEVRRHFLARMVEEGYNEMQEGNDEGNAGGT